MLLFKKKYNKDQLSLTNPPRDVLHHGERAANKQCGRSA